MPAPAFPDHHPASCQAREILDRIGDKWSVYVIWRLGEGTKRFNELKREVEGVSQRMLTVTLRGLERDGIVARKMYAVMPPRVEYSLTDMGRTLLDKAAALAIWAEEHLDDIQAARTAYDVRAKEIESFD